MQSMTADPPSPRRDPAPSRTAYRLQRLWLTPVFRALMRQGLPVFVLVFGGGWFVSDQARVDGLLLRLADLRASIEERPEFMVNVMAIHGASGEVTEDIREILPIDFPVTSFDLDLEAMRRTVEGLDAVESAALRVRPGGILELSVRERMPVVVWRHPDGIELLDGTGHRVSALRARAGRADLPLIAGRGGDRAVPESLRLLAAAAPLHGWVRGLIRVGERRWDLVLTGNRIIRLPEEGAEAALERLVASHLVHDLLRRDVTVVDLRHSGRPTVRLTQAAMAEMRRMRASPAEDIDR
ncbi:MAG: cell division protein FtsQ/DivIB [Pseudomonadota bacterium]